MNEHNIVTCLIVFLISALLGLLWLVAASSGLLPASWLLR